MFCQKIEYGCWDRQTAREAKVYATPLPSLSTFTIERLITKLKYSVKPVFQSSHSTWEYWNIWKCLKKCFKWFIQYIVLESLINNGGRAWILYFNKVLAQKYIWIQFIGLHLLCQQSIGTKVHMDTIHQENNYSFNSIYTWQVLKKKNCCNNLYIWHEWIFQDYKKNVKKIPTACITIEDAEMMHRMQKRGKYWTNILQTSTCHEMFCSKYQLSIGFTFMQVCQVFIPVPLPHLDPRSYLQGQGHSTHIPKVHVVQAITPLC